jgi:hypothetical protein
MLAKRSGSYKRSGDQAGRTSAFALKTPPLGQADLAIFRQLIDEIAPDWTVELQGLCAEEACLVLLPEGGDDSNGPSFVVSRENFGFKLDRLHWDELTEVGMYASRADVLKAIHCRIAFFSESPHLSSVTIH